MGAVLIFLLVFTCAWVFTTYGPVAAVLVAVAAFAIAGLVDVILPTLYVNRRWFAWHLNRLISEHRRPAVQPWATRGPGSGDEAWPLPGRPDLDAELRAAGWDAWSAAHRLTVVDVAPDPGHPGADLTLFEVTAGPWTGTRLVQVVDASPNERGLHERHAIPVPPSCRTASEAIAATWGLTPDAYRPQRHT